MRIVVLVVFLTFVSFFANAQEADFQKAAVTYLEEPVRPVFIAGCRSGEDKYYLILDSRDLSGRLLNTRQERIVNIAKARIDGVHVHLDFMDTQGGVYSYDVLEKRKKDLVGKPFQFMSSKEVLSYINTGAVSACEKELQ